MYEIQSGVPIPRTAKNSKFPLQQMRAGDSFLIPHDERERQSVSQFARTKQIKIKTQRDGDGIRVWRVA